MADDDDLEVAAHLIAFTERAIRRYGDTRQTELLESIARSALHIARAQQPDGYTAIWSRRTRRRARG